MTPVRRLLVLTWAAALGAGLAAGAFYLTIWVAFGGAAGAAVFGLIATLEIAGAPEPTEELPESEEVVRFRERAEIARAARTADEDEEIDFE